MEIESWSDVQEQMVTGKYLTAILRKYNKLLHYEELDQKQNIVCCADLYLPHVKFEKLLMLKRLIPLFI